MNGAHDTAAQPSQHVWVAGFFLPVAAGVIAEFARPPIDVAGVRVNLGAILLCVCAVLATWAGVIIVTHRKRAPRRPNVANKWQGLRLSAFAAIVACFTQAFVDSTGPPAAQMVNLVGIIWIAAGLAMSWRWEKQDRHRGSDPTGLRL